MEFSIDSSVSANSLRFTHPEHDYFIVHSSGVACASVRVCTYTDEKGLLNFINELAAFNKPWKSARKWESIESQFSLSAICSSVGEVCFSFQLKGMLGHPEEWQLRSSILVDFGQLPHLATQADRFFNHVPTQ